MERIFRINYWLVLVAIGNIGIYRMGLRAADFEKSGSGPDLNI